MTADVLTAIGGLTSLAAVLFAVLAAGRARRGRQPEAMRAWLFAAMWAAASMGADKTMLVLQDTNAIQAATIATQQETARLKTETQGLKQEQHEIELGEPGPFPVPEPAPTLILL